jgi:hypothetical protein
MAGDRIFDAGEIALGVENSCSMTGLNVAQSTGSVILRRSLWQAWEMTSDRGERLELEGGNRSQQRERL